MAAYPPTVAVTASGRWMDLVNPQADTVCLADIAHHLARINRYAGAAEQPVSGGQHSVLVSKALDPFGPRLAMLGLLHDAHEAYIGDIISPMRWALREFTYKMGFCPVAHLAGRIDVAIWNAFGLDQPTAIEAETIARADAAALASEWAKAMPGRAPTDELPARVKWAFLAPDRAEAAFLDRFDKLRVLLPGVKRP